MKTIFLVSLWSVFLVPQAHALKLMNCWKKSVDIANKQNELHKSKGWLEQTVDTTFQISTVYPTTGMTSTVSFISSTGPCSAMARNEQRKWFIEENMFYVKLDSAKGNGDYLDTLAVLSGCESTHAMKKFSEGVHQHFSDIYNVESDGAAAQPGARIGQKIDKMISTDTQLHQMCSVAI